MTGPHYALGLDTYFSNIKRDNAFGYPNPFNKNDA